MGAIPTAFVGVGIFGFIRAGAGCLCHNGLLKSDAKGRVERFGACLAAFAVADR